MIGLFYYQKGENYFSFFLNTFYTVAHNCHGERRKLAEKEEVFVMKLGIMSNFIENFSLLNINNIVVIFIQVTSKWLSFKSFSFSF